MCDTGFSGFGMNKITNVEAGRIVSILNETIDKISIINNVPIHPDIGLTDRIEVIADCT